MSAIIKRFKLLPVAAELMPNRARSTKKPVFPQFSVAKNNEGKYEMVFFWIMSKSEIEEKSKNHTFVKYDGDNTIFILGKTNK